MLRDWQERFAQALLMPQAAQVPDFLGAQQHRLAIYQDNVIGSLVDALGETFPVTRQLLGERFFNAIAVDFVRDDLPAAPRLSRYGAGLPPMLRDLPQLQELGYVADVATLEWARVESYFAGVATTSVTAETMLALPAEQLPSLVFQAAPSLRVVSTATAALTIWLAHQTAEPDLAGIDPWQRESTRVICTERGVTVAAIGTAQAAFLSSLVGAADLAAAYAVAAALAPDFNLQAALAAELAAGSFAGADVSGPMS